MNTTMSSNAYAANASPECKRDEIPLLPSPPNRFVRRFTVAIIVEALTLFTVMVTVASGHFGLFNYLLALTGVLIMLTLVTRSFWLAARDEARMRRQMRAWKWKREREAEEQYGPPIAA